MTFYANGKMKISIINDSPATVRIIESVRGLIESFFYFESTSSISLSINLTLDGEEIALDGYDGEEGQEAGEGTDPLDELETYKTIEVSIEYDGEVGSELFTWAYLDGFPSFSEDLLGKVTVECVFYNGEYPGQLFLGMNRAGSLNLMKQTGWESIGYLYISLMDISLKAHQRLIDFVKQNRKLLRSLGSPIEDISLSDLNDSPDCFTFSMRPSHCSTLKKIVAFSELVRAFASLLEEIKHAEINVKDEIDCYIQIERGFDVILVDWSQFHDPSFSVNDTELKELKFAAQ